MNKFLAWPVWFLELFTEAKSFRANPVIGSYWLNRLGLHVFRLVVAHLIMRLRMHIVSWQIPAEHRKAWFRDGYLQLDNFLDEALLLKLRQDIESYQGETRESIQGDTYTRRTVLPPSTLDNHTGFKSLFADSRFRRYCRFTAGHVRPPLFYIETVLNGYSEGSPDPQKTFHADTFHPTMKCWFFTDTVPQEAGPFTYIRGSHRLSWKRIKWEYHRSLTAHQEKNGYAANGSLRYQNSDLEQLDTGEIVSFTVMPNTLLFANTFGIHRRGDCEGKQARTAIWGDSRTNPFLPFPGISNDWINEFQYRVLENFRRKADEKAAANGIRSPWKLLESVPHRGNESLKDKE